MKIEENLYFWMIGSSKMKNIIIFWEASLFHFWVHPNPIFIEDARFHASKQEKYVIQKKY